MSVLVRIGVVLVLLIALLLGLPFLIDLNKYQDQYRPLIEAALNRKIAVKDVRLTLLPKIGARVADLVVRDDPAFSSDPFASLASVDIRVSVLPLLLGRVEVDEIVLRDPMITLVKNRQGSLNISTIGKQDATKPAGVPSPQTPGAEPLKVLALLGLERVMLMNGQLSYRDLSAATGSSYALQELNLDIRHVRLGETATIHLTTVAQPLNLPLTMAGTIGPLDQTLDLEKVHLQLISGHSSSPDRAMAVPLTLPSKKPLTIKDLQISAELKGHEARLQNLSFQLLQGLVTGQAQTTLGSDSPPFNGKVTMQGLQLGPLMDSAGVERVSVSGTAHGDMAVQGRGFAKPMLTRNLKGSGHLVLKDGRIEGINLFQEAMILLNTVGFSQDMVKFTVFSILDSTFEIKGGRLNVSQFRMECPGFQVTATGTVGLDQTLNVKASLNLSEALSKQIVGSSPAVNVALTQGRMRIPLVITGTTQAPSFGLDSEAIKGQVKDVVKTKAAEAASGFISNALEKSQNALKKLFGQ
jgi:AsmA protein